jgi:hypothetical protein
MEREHVDDSDGDTSGITWESFVRVLQDDRWVAQGVDPEVDDPTRWVQPALWWADGVVAEFGGSRPWVYSDEPWPRK